MRKGGYPILEESFLGVEDILLLQTQKISESKPEIRRDNPLNLSI